MSTRLRWQHRGLALFAAVATALLASVVGLVRAETAIDRVSDTSKKQSLAVCKAINESRDALGDVIRSGVRELSGPPPYDPEITRFLEQTTERISPLDCQARIDGSG